MSTEIFDDTAIDPNDLAYNQALQHLLSAFNMVAPSGAIQREMATRVHEDQTGISTRKDVLLWATGRLYDGLASGNWPTP